MRPASAFWSGFRWGADGNMLSLPFIAYEAATAQRGEVIPTATGRVAGLMAYPALAGVMAAGVAMMPGVGVAAAGLIAGLMALYPNALLEDGISRRIRVLSNAARQVRRLEMGGAYEDTETAQRQRMLAVQEMSSTMQISRRYLGQEARLFHR